MPEGGEVATVANELRDKLANTTLTELHIYPRAKCTNFEKLPIGSNIERITSHGKRIIFHWKTPLGEETKMISFLAMVGRWDWHANANHKHLHLKLKNEKDEIIDAVYSDYRYFGFNKYFDNLIDFQKEMSKLGPDLLSETFTKEQFVHAVNKSKRCSIVRWMIDQSKIAGIGNYLRSEILYQAGINPERKVGSLTNDEIDKLYECSYRIIRESYKYGGLTISTYKTPNGKLGSYPTKVYHQSHDPNGNKVQTITVNSQKVFYVPNLQK
jgi:endonuclease-8